MGWIQFFQWGIEEKKEERNLFKEARAGEKMHLNKCVILPLFCKIMRNWAKMIEKIEEKDCWKACKNQNKLNNKKNKKF